MTAMNPHPIFIQNLVCPSMAMSKILLSLSLTPPPPSTTPISNPPCTILLSRRISILTALITTTTTTTTSSIVNIPCAAAQTPPPPSSSNTSKSFLSGISNTKSWFQFYGSGFSIRVPPNFEDIMEPEDYNAGLSLYGDKAKPKTFAARFASTDGSEVVSVVVRPSNSLKITFLEAKDITDLGSLKEAAKIFVPGGTTLYSARTIKIKEDEGYRNYYFYEFGNDEQHAAIVAAVSSGKAIIAGATAPQNKWDDHGIQLRSSVVSLTVL